MKKTICFILCSLMLAAPVLAAPEDTLSVSAPAAILIHESGEILWEKNSHEPRQPASVTKIMTMLLIMEALDRGDITLNDTVTASKTAAAMGGSQIWLKEGERLTVHEMLKCIAVVSANDCCVAMAEHLSGNEQSFVAEMNRRAGELGMRDTTFKNCHGLTEEGHVTSAHDIAVMSRELLRHKSITEYTTIWMDSVRDGKMVLTSTNKLLKKYDGLTGLKTGFTATAGYCISASAQRGGMKLIAVVMGEKSPDERTADITAMLNHGFMSYTCVAITADVPLLPVPVSMGKLSAVSIGFSDETPILTRKSAAPNISKKLLLEQKLTAPVNAGDKVGSLEIYLEGELIKTIPIEAKESSPRIGFGDVLRAMLKLITCRG